MVKNMDPKPIKHNQEIKENKPLEAVEPTKTPAQEDRYAIERSRSAIIAPKYVGGYVYADGSKLFTLRDPDDKPLLPGIFFYFTKEQLKEMAKDEKMDKKN